MRLLETELDGPILLAPDIHGDARGFFLESYRANVWAQHGVDDTFVQDNHSRSGRGVLRGMHFAVGSGQAKLVRCARGRIFDVVVDLRQGSPTFGRWYAAELDDIAMHQLFIPEGLAHGFLVLSEVADVTYKCTTVYDPATERGFAYDDEQIGIPWPEGIELQVSERDARASSFAAAATEAGFVFDALLVGDRA